MSARDPLLQAEDLQAGYGRLMVLHGIDLGLADHHCTAVLGPNGVGKSTLMKTLAGTLPMVGGRLRLLGEDVTHKGVAKRLKHIGWVPEGRLLFGDLSVLDNLRLSARAAGRSDDFEASLDECVELMPVIREKLRVPAKSLSGGQQQMVAIARALVRRPRILMLDEPSMGLAPKVVDDVRAALTRLRDQGLCILIAEQNISWLAGWIDSVALLQHGRVHRSGSADLLEDREAVRALYLGA